MNTISKNQINYYCANANDEGQRLDNLLTKLLKGVPKSFIYRIIRNKEVRVNNMRAKSSTKVIIGDIIRIPPVQTSAKLLPKVIPNPDFPIIFEDDYFLVINKPSGVACHGGSGISFGVIEQLRANCPQYPFLELVHRLYRDTSGALILAKKRLALTKIQELIRNGHIRKYYYALTLGKWQNKALNIKLPLYKYLTNTGERRVRVDSQLGQDSYTKFSVIKYFNFQDFDLTLVKADLKTGRTHQIRVHLQNIQHPIIGDEKYGNFELNKKLFKFGLKRMFLHAFFIEFTHPIINQIIKIEAPLSIELANFLDEQLNYSQE